MVVMVAWLAAAAMEGSVAARQEKEAYKRPSSPRCWINMLSIALPYCPSPTVRPCRRLACSTPFASLMSE